MRRLAWQDLIGDSDTKSEDGDASPQDKVGWNTKEPPQYGISPMPRQRGAKRARSSSPVSSPAAQSRHGAPAVNVKKLSAALKSPRADPAIELWNRFSLGGATATTPPGAANPALANILVSCSPQHGSFAGPGEGGLRRAVSCGNNWPKRRRVERAEAISSSEGALVGESLHIPSKSSMVNALLQSVTGEINRCKAAQSPQSPQEAPSSPSPKKRRHDSAGRLPSGSPKQRAPPTLAPPQFLDPVEANEKPSPTNGSSDYEDDDFDDDTLMGLDMNISIHHPQELRSQEHASEPAKSKSANTHTPPPAAVLLDDEFGDLDDDIVAAAGELLSQIDSSTSGKGIPTNTTARVSSIANPGINKLQPDDPDDDIYGDDFGDFDFDAAELAATQSAKKPSGPASLPSSHRSRARAIQRYLITQVFDNQYTSDDGRERQEKSTARKTPGRYTFEEIGSRRRQARNPIYISLATSSPQDNALLIIPTTSSSCIQTS
ncbi:hypothetical protein F5Y17DRAFT_193062 [Xylariaceae sp. FL0594]|nr:hypothetical protein F5Y17DRAFT_193062 [Xylariaceae sp. FL0594]